MTNVDILISNGTSFTDAETPKKVSFSSGYRFQYTAENNKIFMMFTGKVPTFSKIKPLFAVSVKLRSFEKSTALPDPVIELEVDKEEVKPDPEPEKPLIDEEEDQKNDTKEIEPIIVTEKEIITITKPVTIREAAEAKPRKKQTSLTILSGVVTLAILIYIVVCLC
jgi:hypothetical protein